MVEIKLHAKKKEKEKNRWTSIQHCGKMFGRFCWKTEISHRADVDFSFEDIQGGCFQSEGERRHSQIKTKNGCRAFVLNEKW